MVFERGDTVLLIFTLARTLYMPLMEVYIKFILEKCRTGCAGMTDEVRRFGGVSK